MGKNEEVRFGTIPPPEVPRSIFDLSHGHMTSFNVGELVPIEWSMCLPGDTWKWSTSSVTRLQTLITPMFSNMELEIDHFAVPIRLIFPHIKEMYGENTSSPWIQPTPYVFPSISAPSGGFATGTLADYFGLPVGVNWNATDPGAPHVLPFRAYGQIINDWWNSEALNYPINVPTGDSNQTGTNGSNFINDVCNGGKPFIAAKYFDLFSSSLPSPQKGPAVTFPLISGSLAPVSARTSDIPVPYSNGDNLRWKHIDALGLSPIASGYHNLEVYSSGTGDANTGLSTSLGTGWAQEGVAPVNLWADLSSSVGSVTVNELRLAFQLQRFYERCARGGTRYIEMIKAHFGVTSPDARLQRSEFLGGHRIPLNVHEITNTAQTNSDFLGDVGAKSVTSDLHEDFEWSCTEPSIIISLAVVRYQHSFSQGIDRAWTRKTLADQYFPVFANIGEVPVSQSEICATSANIATPVTWGYNEAYYDFRYRPDRVSGELRPGIANSLASWHLADYYTTAPTLSASWLQEDKNIVDRVLAVQSSAANQIFADFYFNIQVTRCLPMYSIPGLIDHF